MKTSELTGAALDWAVAKAIGVDTEYDFETDKGWLGPEYQSDWAWGGPIIERERISVWPFDDGCNEWCAELAWKEMRDAPTPLIAAMRCLVAFKLGEEIEVPEGLCNEDK